MSLHGIQGKGIEGSRLLLTPIALEDMSLSLHLISIHPEQRLLCLLSQLPWYIIAI